MINIKNTVSNLLNNTKCIYKKPTKFIKVKEKQLKESNKLIMLHHNYNNYVLSYNLYPKCKK